MNNRKNDWKLFPAMLVLLTVVVGVVAFAADRNYPTAPASFQVGITSTMVAAPRGVRAPNWVAGTVYAQGDMVRSTAHTSRIYWNVTTNAGAATTCPDHIDVDNDATDGNITWRYIIPRSRKGINVQCESVGPVWLSPRPDAVVSNGTKLIQNGTWWEDEKYQGAVYAISHEATNTVITTEY